MASEFQHRAPMWDAQTNAPTYNGRRMRKPIDRKYVSTSATLVRHLESRPLDPTPSDHMHLQPHSSYKRFVRCTARTPPAAAPEASLPPPFAQFSPAFCMRGVPADAFMTRFCHTSVAKERFPVFCAAWTPEGRRLITGASSGQMVMWDGIAFNFVTILQAHETGVRALSWSHADEWMLSGDGAGIVKVWRRCAPPPTHPTRLHAPPRSRARSAAT